MKRRVTLFASILIICISAAQAQFPYTFSAPSAMEAFRTGVVAYNAGRYGESLLFFEQALAAQPGNALGSYWLGKAYYRLGSSSSAFSLWREVLDGQGASPFLESKLELFSLAEDPQSAQAAERYVRSAELLNKAGRDTLFLRPSWIEPLDDGSLLMVAHGSDAVLRIGSNGTIIQRITGGSTGFDRPFSLALLPDGSLLLSEFQANRIVRLASDGAIQGYIGDASGPGRLVGPQYLAVDDDGFIYVSDMGFSRVVKFDAEGRFVLAFGTRSPEFGGLKMPTGLALLNGLVYVADAALKGVYVFDRYGNYQASLAEGRLQRPEGLRVYGGSRQDTLLVADTARIVSLDVQYGTIKELYRAESGASKLNAAAFDVNGDLLGVDFNRSELIYLSDPALRYAGLSLEIIGINQAAYPKLFVDVRVRDKAGRPIVGLAENNFYVSQTMRRTEQRIVEERPVTVLTETIMPAAEYAFEGSLDLSTSLDAVFLIEGSPELQRERNQARNALAELYASIGQGSAALVTAGSVAQPALRGGLAQLSAALLEVKGSAQWRFDSGLRLAASSLFSSQARRAIFFITSGSVNEALLDQQSLSELGALLANNGIAFFAISLGNAGPSPALAYLCERSGGALLRADRPQGLAGIADGLRASASGMYRLSFSSLSDDGFGRVYLPFSVEAYLRGRSGKDESGFFAPLR
jgi:tetratricopeptide (TPR) repeat protein